jgi:hypothetical protein
VTRQRQRRLACNYRVRIAIVESNTLCTKPGDQTGVVGLGGVVEGVAHDGGRKQERKQRKERKGKK